VRNCRLGITLLALPALLKYNYGKLAAHTREAILTVTDRRSASLSLKQLAYLLAVRDSLNFTRAAEQCFVTQSSLSGGLAELERSLGLKLVERSRQRVSMTPVGEAVCVRAEQILAASEDLFAFARAQSEPGTGSLRLGIIPTIAPYVLHDFLAACAEHFPGLELFLHERQTESLLDQVSGGELDAAVLALPMDTRTLAVTHLFDDPLRLLAAPGHSVVRRDAPLRLSAIDTSQIILLEPGHCLREHILSACGVGAQASRRFEASNIDTLVQLAEAGFGLALVPAMAIAHGVLRDTSLIEISLQTPPLRGIALVTRPSHPLREFLEREVAALFIGAC